MDDERLAYLALVQVPGMGPTRLHTLLTACHTPLGAHSASFAFLCTLPGITSACATAIGVLGNGLGVIYPAANRALYERIAEHGLLLTEFPPGERPHAGSFPKRNRLISGLARVTAVVEAAVGSGALITAGTALDQGREVIAVPGPVTSPVSTGTNRLIRDGATPYLEPVDLLQYYPEAVLAPLEPVSDGQDVQPLPETLTSAERQVAELLGA